MTTADEFAFITNKKLMGHVDFDVYLLKYLRKQVRAATSRLFVQGSFQERMPISSPGGDQIEVEPKPTLLDGMAHDGAGNLLDLGEIDRVALFENVNGQTYEVGAEYIEYPFEIRINPRTGRPEYDRFVEGVGVQAQPNSVSVVGVDELTFTVDSLFEQGGSLGNHAGREVRVFRIVPADGALTASVAIEVATVTYDGANRITTGALGQAAPETSASQYVVQLIGLTVLRDTASNRPSERPDEVFFIGTVEGNGSGITPTVFDTSAQSLIEAQSAASVLVAALGAWADGTTNPADDLQAVLEKFVADLTSTTGARGAGKLTAPALANWADTTANPATTLAAALAKFVTDLTSTTGVRGTGKLTAPALSGPSYSLSASHLTTTLEGFMTIVNDLATKQAQQYQRGILGSTVNAMIDLRDHADGFPGGASIRSFASDPNNGSIVGVGEGGAIVSSEDGGLTWTTRTAGASYSGRFNDVIYSLFHNRFVAVGDELEIQTSLTGETWTRVVSIGGGNLYAAVESYDGNIVAVGDFCVRTDFTTTSLPALPGIPYVAIDLIFDDGTLIAGGPTGDSATSAARSIDGGATWTAVDLGLESVESIAAEDFGLVVDGRISFAGPDRETHRTLNGITWTSIGAYNAPVEAKHVVLACGQQFILRAFGEPGQQHSLRRSLDGVLWRQVAFNVPTIGGSVGPDHRVKALKIGPDTYQIFVPHAAIGAGDPSWAVSAPWTISSFI